MLVSIFPIETHSFEEVTSFAALSLPSMIFQLRRNQEMIPPDEKNIYVGMPCTT